MIAYAPKSSIAALAALGCLLGPTPAKAQLSQNMQAWMILKAHGTTAARFR